MGGAPADERRVGERPSLVPDPLECDEFDRPDVLAVDEPLSVEPPGHEREVADVHAVAGGDRVDIEVQRRQPLPCRRRVRRRLRARARGRGVERAREHRGTSTPFDVGDDGGEVGEVADAPAAVAARRVELNRHSEAAGRDPERRRAHRDLAGPPVGGVQEVVAGRDGVGDGPHDRLLVAAAAQRPDELGVGAADGDDQHRRFSRVAERSADLGSGVRVEVAPVAPRIPEAVLDAARPRGVAAFPSHCDDLRVSSISVSTTKSAATAPR